MVHAPERRPPAPLLAALPQGPVPENAWISMIPLIVAVCMLIALLSWLWVC